MKILSRNKRFVFFIIIILLLAAAGVFLWWWEKPESQLKQWWIEEIKIGWSVRNFSIKNTSDEKIIENKKEGFKVVVPEGWTVKKEYESMAFSSPEVKFDEKGSLIFESIRKGGCGMSIQIKKYRKEDAEIPTSVEYLNMVIEGVKKGLYIDEKEPKYEIVIIGGKEGLKNTYIKENQIKYITLEIPVDDTVYSFDSGLIFSDKCVEEFNKILETVSITK